VFHVPPEPLMTTRSPRFYVTGGSLSPDDPSYVRRKGDQELYDAVLEGEFCYVLTARQMGKSSLMVRTAARLREQGVRVAVLDLTAIGQNVGAEQWYYSLLCCLGEQFGLEEALEGFWLARSGLSPLRRFFAAVEQVLLPSGARNRSHAPATRAPEHGAAAPGPAPVVIFVDEIDAVRSLPFPTDEFFAGIRECYNRRSENPSLRRLTFCLLGTAAPTDLIRDTRMTPFNIGRRIELADFSEAEAAPLAEGLEPGMPAGVARSLLRRVLFWTAGHPYLTQRLCQAVAAQAPDGQPAKRRAWASPAVDAHCEALFLARSAQEKDDNLIFVRERLLRSDADLAGLLELYGRILRGKPVAYDETDPLCSLLRLSGIVRVLEGASPRLAVRNRIYARVFDERWVVQRMPDAELRRQRAAYRRGLVRATVLSGVVAVLLGSLAWTALRLADDRRQALLGAGDVLYASQMNLAHLALREGKIVRAQRLLELHRPATGQPDRRDFAWRYLWRLSRSQDRRTFPARSGEVNSVAFSPDGKVLAAGAADGTVQVWDAAGNALLATLPAHQGHCTAAFSPDGRLLATAGGQDGLVKLWELSSIPLARPARLRRQFKSFRRPFPRALFTPDGKTLIAGGEDDTVRLWDLRPGPHAPDERRIPIRAAGPLALSPDGGTLAVCAAAHAGGGLITLWDIRAGKVRRLPRALPPVGGLVETIAFSPDGRRIATGARETVILWDARMGRVLRKLRGHEGVILSLAFSPDGRLLASSGLDATSRLWEPDSGRPAATLQGHTARVACLAFSPDGMTLASGSRDHTSRLWDPRDGSQSTSARERSGVEVLSAGCDSVAAVAFSPDGRLLSEVRARSVSLWDVASRTRAGAPLFVEPRAERFGIRRSCQFSPDGRLLATASADGSVRVWNLPARRALSVLPGTASVVSSLCFAPGGMLVTANGGGVTGATAARRFWDVASGRLLATEPGDSSRVQGALALSPDGRTIASAGPGRRVELWDAASRRRVALLEGEVQAVSLAFSPDGATIAAGETEGAVYLWDRRSGRRLRRMPGHIGPCQAVAFSPDGKTLASGGMDGMVRLWNPGVDQEEATLTGHTDWVWTLAFSPDGRLLATGSADGTVRLWRAASFEETDRSSAAQGD
jgi:WD40 repeat protein